MREVEEERRMGEMSEEENNKAQSEAGGENRDISPNEPDTESVKEHEVYKSTMQGIREILAKPMKVKTNLDISPKEVDASEVKTEKVSEVKVGERKSSWKPRKRLQTKKTESEKKRMKYNDKTDPLYKVKYLQLSKFDGKFRFVVNLHQRRKPKSEDFIAIMAEMSEELPPPFFARLDEIIQREKQATTYGFQVYATSREHLHVFDTFFFIRLHNWNVQRMKYILKGLSDKLTMKENLNKGLILDITFYEAAST